jgi:hypothetical protein
MTTTAALPVLPRDVAIIVTRDRLAREHPGIDAAVLPIALLLTRREQFAVTHPRQLVAALARIEPARLAWMTEPGEDQELLSLLQRVATQGMRRQPEPFDVLARPPFRERMRYRWLQAQMRFWRALAWCVGLR